MSCQVTGASWSYNLQCGGHRFWNQQWERLPCTSGNYCNKLNGLIVTCFSSMTAFVLQGNCTASIINWSWIRQQQCATKHNTDLCHQNHYPAQTTTMLPKRATRLLSPYWCVCCKKTVLCLSMESEYSYCMLPRMTTATTCMLVTTCCCTFYKGTGLHPSVESENKTVFERSCKWPYKFAAVTLWLYSYVTVYSSPLVPWFLLEHDHQALMAGAG